MRYKLDLHTHSYGSPDGGLNLQTYRQMLEKGRLDYVAITDHNTIEAALQIQTALGALGERIIIGEEITTTEGEIIGLFLHSRVSPDQSPEETIAAIKKQNGLVYVPHPFEMMRSGLSAETFRRIVRQIDIVEICNGRAIFEDKSAEAKWFAQQHPHMVGAASSDAHGSHGWGRTYTIVAGPPTRGGILGLLANARYSERKVGLGIIYPKLNRMRKFRSV